MCEAADVRQKPMSPLALPCILLHSHVNSSLANDDATIFSACISLLQFALNSRNFNGGTTVWVLEMVTPAHGQMFLHSTTHWRSVCVCRRVPHSWTYLLNSVLSIITGPMESCVDLLSWWTKPRRRGSEVNRPVFLKTCRIETRRLLITRHT